MAYVYTTLVSDSFRRADENPVADPPWSGGEGGIDPTEETHCQIIANELCPTQPAPYDSVATYTGVSWLPNQWAECQLDVLNNPDGEQYAAFIIVLRTDSGTDGYHGSHYNFEVDGPLGPDCLIEIYAHLNSVVQQIFFNGTVPFFAGDSLHAEIFGNLLSCYIIHNGVKTELVPPTECEPDSIITSGNVGLQLYENVDGSSADVQVSNFSAGTLFLAPPQQKIPLPFSLRLTAAVTLFLCYQQAKVAQTLTKNATTIIALQQLQGQMFSTYLVLRRQDVGANQKTTLNAAVSDAQTEIEALYAVVASMPAPVPPTDDANTLPNVVAVVAAAVQQISNCVVDE